MTTAEKMGQKMTSNFEEDSLGGGTPLACRFSGDVVRFREPDFEVRMG